MKNFLRMILLIAVCMQTLSLSAQCGFNTTILTNGAACGATGSINVQVSNATGPLLYRLDSLSTILVPYNTSNVFSGLLPGTYAVTIKDLGTSCVSTVSPIMIDTIASPIYFAITPQHVTTCNNGEIIDSSSGGTLPYAYTLTGSTINISNSTTGHFTNLAPGTYTVSLEDHCGNIQTRDTTILGFNWNIQRDSTTKMACNSYRLFFVQLTQPLPGAIFSVKFGSSTLASGNLPLTFTHPDTSIQGVTVCATYCGITHCKPLDTTYSWGLTGPSLHYTACNQYTVDSFQLIGNPLPPLQYGVVISSPIDTILSYSPTIQFAHSNTQSAMATFFVKDACGVVRSSPYSFNLDLLFNKHITFDSCDKSSLAIAPRGFYLPPLQYSINNGPYQTSNIFHNLTDGSYTVTIVDQCLDSVKSVVNIDHSWNSGGETDILCNIGYFRDAVYIMRRMMPPVTIKRYQQTFTQLVDSVRITPAGLSDGDAGMTDYNSKYYFYNSLPGTTYIYVISDSCGRKDTVTIPHGANGLLPYDLQCTVQPLCINRGNITANFNYYGASWNHVMLSIWDINSPNIPIELDLVTGTTNGSHTWFDLPVGTYVVRMKTSWCSLETFDTVTVQIYTQPDFLSYSANYISPNIIQCTAQGQFGVPPYRYEIFETVPPGGQQLIQSLGVFTITGQYDSIRLRVWDTCDNATPKTLYAYPQGQFPLSLGSISASAQPTFSGAMIQWTSQEQGVSYFRIERSADAVHFNKLADLQAQSNSSGTTYYHFPDAWPVPFISRTFYYRVTSFAMGQSLHTSNIVSVTHDDVSPSLLISPLPFKSFLDVQIFSDADQAVQFMVYDLTGRCLLSQNEAIKKGSNQLRILNLQDYLPGNYLLKYIDARGNVIVKKLTKL